ncbi:hypothetical protein [Winogradskya humida]|uniref:Uncharacterized protein n=1 Tax=Winogradskya humida TaxID=113566 RepID=A0ABQ3ZZU0_9ACTN|nr:hypothetical protein [Actinoplanes humidus]GIE24150.1 hypothetical protein Ahu01nite_072520 [Actinoplanes humidus]
MDHDDSAGAELDRLLDRASRSAVPALEARIDVERRLRELHDEDLQRDDD